MEATEQAGHHRRARYSRQQEIVEDYVELIADLIKSLGEARAVEIARRVGVSQARVAKIIARLQEAGLVTSEPYRAIFLTEEGRKLAEWSKLRHDVVLDFLRAIGVREDIARADAEGIEHHVSKETIIALERVVREHKESQSAK